jgi:hypothetical protein
MNLEEPTTTKFVFYGRGECKGIAKLYYPTGWSPKFVKKIDKFARLSSARKYFQNINESRPSNNPKYYENQYDGELAELSMEIGIYADTYRQYHTNGYSNVEIIEKSEYDNMIQIETEFKYNFFHSDENG